MQAAIFGASYARLANAAREDPDPLPEVQDARRYLASALEGFSKVRLLHCTYCRKRLSICSCLYLASALHASIAVCVLLHRTYCTKRLSMSLYASGLRLHALTAVRVQAQPGAVRQLLQSHVQPGAQAILQTFCATAGVTIA